ncbi:MAG: hypothetical protein ACMUJM_02855 [bacterium]
MENIERVERICPDCLRINICERDHQCTSPLIPLCDPEKNKKIIIGVIRLLEGRISPNSLLRVTCNGVGRYPHNFSSHPSDLACRQHDGYSVWLWSALFSKIPAIDAIDNTDNKRVGERVLYALSITSILLIEAPLCSGYFRVRYKQRNPEPGLISLLMIVNHLEPLVEYLGIQLEEIGIIGDKKNIEHCDEGMGQLKLWPGCPHVTLFPKETNAVKALVHPKNIQFKPHFKPFDTSLSFQMHYTDDHRVGVIDIGGDVGRDFLSLLHENTYTRVVPLPIEAVPSKNHLNWIKIQKVRAIRPGPMDKVPAWIGFLNRGMWGRASLIKVALLTDKSCIIPKVIIIGAGTDRIRGEYQLARLLEWSWKNPSGFILLRRSDTDSKLERWARRTFPTSPLFNLSDGIIPPLKAALSLLHK